MGGGDLEARKQRDARAKAYRDALQKEEVLDKLTQFIKEPTNFARRRRDVEKDMALRTAELLYSGLCPKLRLGAAIGISRSYDKMAFDRLRQLASDVLTDDYVDRLNERYPLDDLDHWLLYSKLLREDPKLLVLASLEFAWAYASKNSCDLLPLLLEVTKRYSNQLESKQQVNPARILPKQGADSC
ncbi:hypothetical protein N658DRAFT_109274 [Parathielavia hyrcaniae]|uniref:Uncharacterized protein n=1 Tax=Parathielavia hyrcaniae TaxID=113614 RepID=A0AAN6PTB9_9PEZI|nr:hypothetical protein N658DRAFT_109274 [Parathielavia hyrcaniae]